MMRCSATYLLVLCLSTPTTAQSPDVAALERAVAAKPTDVRGRRMLADAYLSAERPMDAVSELLKATTLAPRVPSVWYALGHAYNAIKQGALATFGDPSDAPWRQLLSADALLANNHLTDAFAVYQGAIDRLPSMVTIHDSAAHIYERTGHHAWAVRERAKGRLTHEGCARRKALCEFRAGRYRSALAAAFVGSDPESRYWRARAANELALAAFRQLDVLPDSAERRGVRARGAHDLPRGRRPPLPAPGAGHPLARRVARRRGRLLVGRRPHEGRDPDVARARGRARARRSRREVARSATSPRARSGSRRGGRARPWRSDARGGCRLLSARRPRRRP